MKIFYSRVFFKMLNRAPIEIQTAFRDRVSLFLENPYNEILHNHKLSGEYKGHRSINITGDWRAVYRATQSGVCFFALGTHSKLYRK